MISDYSPLPVKLCEVRIDKIEASLFGAEASDSESVALKQIHLNLKDRIASKEMVEFGADRESVSISKYKEMVEEKIVELARSLVA